MKALVCIMSNRHSAYEKMTGNTFGRYQYKDSSVDDLIKNNEKIFSEIK